MNIREKLAQKGTLLLDGAMGTYYNLRNDKKLPVVDMAVLDNPNEVKAIYREYLEAGADVLNTNTFSSNTYKLGIHRKELKKQLQTAYLLAKNEASPYGKWVAADIGPLPEMVGGEEISHHQALEEYFFIIDCFLEMGCDLFNFETFSTTAYIKDLAAYIKKKSPDAFVMTSFVLNSNGYTVRDYSAQTIIDSLSDDINIDVVGFNCGTGPTHLYHNLQHLVLPNGYFSVVPNASYPEVIDDHIIYSQNPEYFTEIMMDMRRLGIQVLGGCCGTTPDHIRLLRQAIDNEPWPIERKPGEAVKPEVMAKKRSNPFAEKMQAGKFIIAVELPPPSDANIDDVKKMAKKMKRAGADIVTFSDSPLGRARTNPIALSAKIKREVGICALPHLCCRDRNTIALKSDLLGAYIEDLNNILLVTGDPIPQAERSEISSIFNLNSFKLIELVHSMNQSVFGDNPFYIGAALNLNVSNPDRAVERMSRKRELGADFFMTQPIYEQAVVDYLHTNQLGKHYKILAGIMPIVNYKNARFLNNEIPGVHIPESILAHFHESQNKNEAEQIGINLALKTIESLRHQVAGIYLITPLNRIEMIEHIIKTIRQW